MADREGMKDETIVTSSKIGQRLERLNVRGDKADGQHQSIGGWKADGSMITGLRKVLPEHV